MWTRDPGGDVWWKNERKKFRQAVTLMLAYILWMKQAREKCILATLFHLTTFWFMYYQHLVEGCCWYLFFIVLYHERTYMYSVVVADFTLTTVTMKYTCEHQLLWYPVQCVCCDKSCTVPMWWFLYSVFAVIYSVKCFHCDISCTICVSFLTSFKIHATRNTQNWAIHKVALSQMWNNLKIELNHIPGQVGHMWLITFSQPKAQTIIM